MRFFRPLVLAFIAGSCMAQSALVVRLSSSDAAMAKQVHQQMEDADKKWNELQAEIALRYLVVDKTDPDAGDDKWYPPEKNTEGIITSGFIAAGNLTISSTGTIAFLGDDDRCDPKKIAAHEAWEKEQRKAEEERDAKSRRWRKGWYPEHNCWGCSPLPFEYTSNFQYIVPKEIPPKPAPNNGFGWGNVVPTNLAVQ